MHGALGAALQPALTPLAKAAQALVLQQFNPRSLFAANEQGVFYDPSDFERYMAKGPELCAIGTFDNAAAWGMAGLPDWQIAGGKLQKTGTTAGGGPVAVDLAGVVAGRTYEVTFTIDSVAGGGFAVQFNDAVNGSVATTTMNAPGTYRFTLVAVSSLARFRVTANVAGVTGVVDSVSVRELTAIDTASLYQDAAGTVPVTAVEQPVGLMLDKRFGYARGAELVANGAFDSASGWNLMASYSISGGKLNVNGGVAFAGADYPLAGMAGKTVEVVLKATRTSGTGNLVVQAANTTQTTMFVLTAASGGTYRGIATMPAGASPRIAFVNDSTGAWVGTIDDVSVREIPGNHASQATAAARPVLSARLNLLLSTTNAGLGSAPWALSAVTVAQSGGMVELTDTGTGSNHNQIVTVPSGAVATYAVTLKRGTTDWVRVAIYNNALTTDQVRCWVNLATGALGQVNTSGAGVGASAKITALGDGRYRVALSGSAGPTATAYACSTFTAGGDGDTNRVVGASRLIADPQLELGTTATRYQRVNTATDYDSAGFPHYLKFDGVDDWMSVPLNLSATNKLTVFAGIVKLSDASLGIYAEHNFGGGGAWTVNAPRTPGSANVGVDLRDAGGTLTRYATTPAAPCAFVHTALMDYAAALTDQVRTRVNGVDGNETLAGTARSGSFGSGALTIGGRSAGGFSGRLHSLIVRSTATDAARIAACERYVANKTGVTL